MQILPLWIEYTILGVVIFLIAIVVLIRLGILQLGKIQQKVHSQILKIHKYFQINSKQQPQLELDILEEVNQITLSNPQNLQKEERDLQQNKEDQSFESLGKREMEVLNSDRSQNQKLIEQNIKINSGESQNENNDITNFDKNKQNNDAKQHEDQQDAEGMQVNLEINTQKIEIETIKQQDVDNTIVKTNRAQLSKQISHKEFQESVKSSNESNSSKVLPLQNEIQEKKEKTEEVESQIYNTQRSICIAITPTDNKNTYKYIRINKNKLMYVNDQYNYYTGLAFYYKVQYDMDNNPKFEMYEGQFDKGKKSGKGRLYGGKSKCINYDGDWKDDQQYIQTKEQEGDVQIQEEKAVQPKKKISIFEDGQLVQIEKKNSNQIPFGQQTQWVKFNQQYCTKDMDILKRETSWFTSSIIDGFAQYLNILMENQLINFLKKEVKRHLFCPSYLYTNMSQDRIQDNLIIFQNYILEFEPIDFNLEPLFQRVYFAINKSNSHFFLLYIDFPSKSLNIVDSIQKHENSYSTEIKIFQNIFQQKITFNNLIPCTQQRNGYDCGPYTCLNMYQDFYNLMQEACPKKEQKIINTPLQMRQFLFDILKNKNIN